MPFDPIAQAAMVVRKVEDVTHDGAPARAVVASRDYPTHIDDLWNAITDKARIPRWFAPVEGELELGGKIRSRAMPAAPSPRASRRRASRSLGNSAAV